MNKVEVVEGTDYSKSAFLAMANLTAHAKRKFAGLPATDLALIDFDDLLARKNVEETSQRALQSVLLVAAKVDLVTRAKGRPPLLLVSQKKASGLAAVVNRVFKHRGISAAKSMLQRQFDASPMQETTLTWATSHFRVLGSLGDAAQDASTARVTALYWLRRLERALESFSSTSSTLEQVKESQRTLPSNLQGASDVDRAEFNKAAQQNVDEAQAAQDKQAMAVQTALGGLVKACQAENNAEARRNQLMDSENNYAKMTMDALAQLAPASADSGDASVSAIGFCFACFVCAPRHAQQLQISGFLPRRTTMHRLSPAQSPERPTFWPSSLRFQPRSRKSCAVTKSSGHASQRCAGWCCGRPLATTNQLSARLRPAWPPSRTRNPSALKL